MEYAGVHGNRITAGGHHRLTPEPSHSALVRYHTVSTVLLYYNPGPRQVRWRGYGSAADSWEPAAQLRCGRGARTIILCYHFQDGGP
jgi:hypothetical protein